MTQPLRFLYSLDISIKEKIEAIAKSYGASGVEYSEQVSFILAGDNTRSNFPLLLPLFCFYLFFCCVELVFFVQFSLFLF